jgi:glutaminyl-tRNA synthetase
MEEPVRKFFRLAPGREVRLRYAYFITCTDVIKDDKGEITEIHCTYDPASRGGNSPVGRKVKGTIHWVSEEYGMDAKVRLYDNLFLKENPEETEEGKDFISNLNPDSLKTVVAKLEPCLKDAKSGERYQFERLGYFCVDTVDSEEGKPVFNRTVGLRDSWKKKMAKKK